MSVEVNSSHMNMGRVLNCYSQPLYLIINYHCISNDLFIAEKNWTKKGKEKKPLMPPHWAPVKTSVYTSKCFLYSSTLYII